MSMTSHAGIGLLRSGTTHTSRLVIQDKTKTQFGKWIHDA